MKLSTGLLVIVLAVALVGAAALLPFLSAPGQIDTGDGVGDDAANAAENAAGAGIMRTGLPGSSIGDADARPTEYIGPPASERPTEYIGPPVPGTGSAPPVSYDVVIAGAGSGGVAAAIQARRLGASVLLIEETDNVGGQMLPVGNMDGGYVLPAGTGIYEEFESRMRAHYADASRFPPSGKSIGTCYWVAGTSCFEPHVTEAVLRDMLAEEGVTLWTGARIAHAAKSGNTVTGVTLADGRRVTSQVLIDATEHGDVIPLTGAQYRVGDSLSPAISPDSCIDDLTYTAMLVKYDSIPQQYRMDAPPPKYEEYKEEFKRTVTADGSNSAQRYPVNFAFHNAYRGVPDSSREGSYTGRQYALITKTYANWANDYPAYATYNPLPEGKLYTLSVSYIEDPAERRRMDCEAKLKTINFIYYVQHELGEQWSVAEEGFDTPYNEAHLCASIPAEYKAIERQMPPFPYVRESRRIEAVDMYTAKEMKASRQGVAIPTSIAVGEYGVDKHNCRDNETLDLGDTTNEAGQGGFFQVPMETLIPREVDGFLAAEKNIGASRLAEGALRLQPITMATGQAAGALAAIAVADGVQPRHVPAAEVQRALTAAGSAVSNMHFTDVPTTSAHWDDVQLTTVDRILVGYGGGRFGPDDPLLRGQAAVAVTGMFGIPLASPQTPTFADVPKNHMFYRQVEALKRDGITAGCSKEPAKYCVDAPITRFQLTVFLTAAGRFEPSGTHAFADVAPGQQRFADIAMERGWFEQCGSGFCPNKVVTRGEMARIIALEK